MVSHIIITVKRTIRKRFLFDWSPQEGGSPYILYTNMCVEPHTQEEEKARGHHPEEVERPLEVTYAGTGDTKQVRCWYQRGN